MSCDRDICATNEYNGIGCDECCVSYDTAVQREQDAYDSGFGKAIESVLEIIDEIEHDMGHTALIGNDNKFAGVLCNSREFRDRVLALKGGEYEDAGNDSCQRAICRKRQTVKDIVAWVEPGDLQAKGVNRDDR